jgi:hypothetical protein
MAALAPLVNSTIVVTFTATDVAAGSGPLSGTVQGSTGRGGVAGFC